MRSHISRFVLYAAVCAAFFAAPLFARTAPNSASGVKPLIAPENGEACGDFMQNRRFFFDDTNFSWVSKFHSKRDDDLGNIDSREGRFKATLFGLPALVTAPASLFGGCDWWPQGLAVVFTMQNQVIMSEGDNPGDPWSVQMNLLGWGPALEFRY